MSEFFRSNENINDFTKVSNDSINNENDRSSKKKSSTKKHELTLTEKLKMIRQSENEKITNVQLARHYGVSCATVSRVIKRKNEYLAISGSTNHDSNNVGQGITLEKSHSTRKRKFRLDANIEINSQVLKWYETCVLEKKSVTGVSLRRKASEIARNLKINNFKASNGWLDCFRTRHGIITSSENAQGNNSADCTSLEISINKTSGHLNEKSSSNSIPFEGWESIQDIQQRYICPNDFPPLNMLTNHHDPSPDNNKLDDNQHHKFDYMSSCTNDSNDILSQLQQIRQQQKTFFQMITHAQKEFLAQRIQDKILYEKKFQEQDKKIEGLYKMLYFTQDKQKGKTSESIDVQGGLHMDI